MPDMLRLNLTPPVAEAIKNDDITYLMPGQDAPQEMTPSLLAGAIVEKLFHLAGLYELRKQGSGVKILIATNDMKNIVGLPGDPDKEFMFLSPPFTTDRLTPEQTDAVETELAALPGIVTVGFAGLVFGQDLAIGVFADREADDGELFAPAPTAIDFGARAWDPAKPSDLSARLARVRDAAAQAKGRVPG